MRIAFLMIIGLLVGCNSDDDSALQQQVSQGITQAQLNAAISAATHADAARIDSLQASLDKLQLIGHPVTAKADSVRTQAMLSEPIVGAPSAATVPGQFGPCSDMGVQDGFNSNIGDALAAISKAFKTCTGYHVEYMTADGSVKIAPRIFWDGPNCTGNLLEWEAGGAGFDTETLQDGVVFINPHDGITELMIPAHQIPKPIFIQSVWVLSNPGCQSDTETQNMYTVMPNVTSITGASNISIGPFTTGAP